MRQKQNFYPQNRRRGGIKGKLTRAEKENEFQNNGTLKKSRETQRDIRKDTRCRRGNKFHHKHESA